VGFFGKLFGNEGDDKTVTDFEAATARAATVQAATAQAATEQAVTAGVTVPPPAEGGFRFVVEDVFSITGRGTVAVGQVASGTITVGTSVAITDAYGTAIPSTVTGIEMFRKQVTTAGPGENIGLLLQGVARDDVVRGVVISVIS